MEWNRLLFDTFVPSAWAAALPILLARNELTDVFAAWPPSQSDAHGGDTVYWNSLPSVVLRIIAKENLRVWPIIDSDGSAHTFSDLTSVLVASSSDDSELLAAFARAGVLVTQPPPHIKALLVETGIKFTLLEPKSARDALLLVS